ncbi:MAG: aminotransferase class V-fold PLP-dependent enzyme, partial [Gemmatimonadetes bacterium]
MTVEPTPVRHGLHCRRDAFSLPPHVHYLNGAYMSPLPRVVEEAGIAGIRRKRLPSELTPPDFFTECDRLRAAFADLVGAPDPLRVALLPAASYGIATAARNLPVERGQNLVLLDEQFPGNVYAWRRLAAERGAELRTVARPGEPPRAAAWNERILEAIDADTAVVTMPVVHWTDGTRFDLEAIASRAREVGAAL